MEKILLLCIIVFCVQRTCTFNTPTGRPAYENQFPYMISLQRLSEIHSANRGHRCEGVLVTLQHALTAAFCVGVFDESVGTLMPADLDEFRVFAGSVLLTNDTSPDRVRRIANIVIHPEYNIIISQNFNNIGVIVLGTPFLSNTVAQISVRDIGTTYDFLQCTAVGWGRGNRLTYTAVGAINDTTCRMLILHPLEPKMVCATPSVFACEDSIGSPLICANSLAGIQVRPIMCSTYARLHIRVSNYTRWIDEVVALPIPELGPEPSTVPPPTTIHSPGAAFKFQPGITLLALAVVFLTLTADVIN